MKIEKASVEATEARHLPGPWTFPAGWTYNSTGPKHTNGRKSSQKLRFGDRQSAACAKLNPILGPKRNSWIVVFPAQRLSGNL